MIRKTIHKFICPWFVWFTISKKFWEIITMNKFDTLVDRRTIDWHTFVSSITCKAVFNFFTSDFVFINHDILSYFVCQWRHALFNVMSICHEVEYIVTSF